MLNPEIVSMRSFHSRPVPAYAFRSGKPQIFGWGASAGRILVSRAGTERPDLFAGRRGGQRSSGRR